MRLKSYELETKEYLCFFHSKRVFYIHSLRLEIKIVLNFGMAEAAASSSASFGEER